MTQKYLIVIILCFLLGACSTDASIMESENYRLESDEINMDAIGEMRDFSGFSQQEKELALTTNQNPKQGQIVVFTYKISAREIIFGSVLVLLLLVFIYYLVPEKRLFSKQ